MIQDISKDDADKILEDFLINACVLNSSKRCAVEAIKIMENFADSQLVINMITVKLMKQQGLIAEHFTVFEEKILSALATVFSTVEKEDVPIQLQDIFEGISDEIVEKATQSKKLQFSVRQFVNSYYHYDYFENKYPEISKML